MEDVFLNATLNTSLENSTAANVAQSKAPDLPTYLHQPLAATVFQITLWSTIVFLGVIGNLLVCIVIIGNPKMKTSMNYYLMSLAIADLGVLLIIYPMLVLKYHMPFRWFFGEQACYGLYPTVEVFFGASIWSITAIAIERYRNIVGAKRYRIGQTYRSRVRSWLVIGIVWLASFLVQSVPLYPVMTYDSISPNASVCYPNMPAAMNVTHLLALFVVLYVLPVVVIAFTYLKIKRRMRDSVVFRTSMLASEDEGGTAFSQALSISERRDKRIWRQSNKVGRILTPLVILFAVTMFPLNAFRVLMLIIPEVYTHSYYNVIIGQVIMFVMINSSANPLVYYITSKEFKDAFKKIFKSLSDRKNFFKQFSSKSKASTKTWIGSGRGEENHGQRDNKKKSCNNSQQDLVNEEVYFITGL